jgi:hypothetical protein
MGSVFLLHHIFRLPSIVNFPIARLLAQKTPFSEGDFGGHVMAELDRTKIPQ